MTVSTTGNRAAYTGNGVTTAFGFSFAFLATGDIKVYLDGSLQSTGYTVSAAPAPSGTVTFSGAPANGVEVVIQRETTKTQNIDYVANDAFAADVTEGGFDRAMLAIQDNAAAIGRTLRAEDWAPPVNPLSDPLNPTAILQTPATQSQAEAGTDNAAYMTPLRTAQLLAALGYVSVKAYPYLAKGDGTTDDTAAIQAAINDNPFGCVYFPAGTYRTTASLTEGTSTNNVRLLGAGEFASAIKRDNDGHVFDLDGVGFWVFDSISIQHSTGLTSGRGVNMTGASSACEFHNVFVVNNPGGGVGCVGTSGSQQSENKFVNCLFLDNGLNGVGAQLHLEYLQDFLISKCDFGRQGSMTGYPAHGVYMLNSSAGLYEGCEHWENTVAFEMAGSCSYTRIIGNRWEESRNENVIIGGNGGYLTIVDNVQHTAGKSAKDTYAGFVIKDTVSKSILRDLVSFSYDVATYRQTYGLSIGASVSDWQIGGQKHDHYLTAPILNSAAFNAIKWTDGVTVFVNADGVTSGLTRYLTPIGVQSSSTGGLCRSPFNGFIAAFNVGANGAPGSGQSFTYQFRINNVLTGSTYTMSGAAAFTAFGAPMLAVTANQSISVELITSASAGTANHSGTVVIIPS